MRDEVCQYQNLTRDAWSRYVDNAFELQKEIMTLASKLSARW